MPVRSRKASSIDSGSMRGREALEDARGCARETVDVELHPPGQPDASGHSRSAVTEGIAERTP